EVTPGRTSRSSPATCYSFPNRFFDFLRAHARTRKSGTTSIPSRPHDDLASEPPGDAGEGEGEGGGAGGGTEPASASSRPSRTASTHAAGAPPAASGT